MQFLSILDRYERWQETTRIGKVRFFGIAIPYLSGHWDFGYWPETCLSHYLTLVAVVDYSQCILVQRFSVIDDFFWSNLHRTGFPADTTWCAQPYYVPVPATGKKAVIFSPPIFLWYTQQSFIDQYKIDDYPCSIFSIPCHRNEFSCSLNH